MLAHQWPSILLLTSIVRAPRSMWPTSRMRTWRPSSPLLRMMFANSSGSDRRPRAWTVDLAGGHLHVLFAYGGDHVAGREVERGQLVGPNPDAHAVVLLAENADVADAVHAGDLVLDLDGGVVADVELVVAVVGRVDADDEEDVGVALARGDAGLLDHVGQHRQREVDAVL